MLPFIFFVSIVFQIALNKLVDEKRVINGRVFVLTGVLLLYLFVLPAILTRTLPEPEPEGVRCGMPVVALLVGLWIIGPLIAIITHVIYYFVNGKQKIYPDD